MSFEQTTESLALEIDYPVDLVTEYLAAGIPPSALSKLIERWYEENVGYVDLQSGEWIEPKPTVQQLIAFWKKQRREGRR